MCLRGEVESSQIKRATTYSLGSVMKRPDRFIDIDLVAKGIGKWWPLGHGRGHGGLEKVHRVARLGGRWIRELRRVVWSANFGLTGVDRGAEYKGIRK